MGAQENKSSYEKSDVSIKKLFIVAGLAIVALVIILFLLDNFFLASKEEQVYDSVLKPGSTELRELRAREVETLTSYKMLDEQNGVVQIPIERAMKLLAEENYENSK